MGHDVTTNLATPLNMGDILDFAEIQILLRLFIQKGRGIKKSTIDCACLSFRWLRAYS